MSQEKEFFSFEEALEELRLKEEELKRLVSEGEIRAFREGETMKLRRRDVESLRGELMGDELGTATGHGSATGDVVALGDTGDELVFEDDPELADPGMATEELGSAETLLEEDLDLEEFEPEEFDLEVDEDPEASETALSATASRRLREDEQAPPEGAGVIALLIANAAVLILLVPVALSTLTGNVSDLARAIASIFVEVPG